MPALLDTIILHIAARREDLQIEQYLADQNLNKGEAPDAGAIRIGQIRELDALAALLQREDVGSCDCSKAGDGHMRMDCPLGPPEPPL